MQNLLEYEDMTFQSASKEDLKLGDKDAKKENKKLRVGRCCMLSTAVQRVASASSFCH